VSRVLSLNPLLLRGAQSTQSFDGAATESM
jgi:hypothetical protein